MTADTQEPISASRAGWRDDAARAEIRMLRLFAIVAGIGWAVAFIAVGVTWRLEEYGDGSIFSYAVAVRDAFAFHWHNISGRLSVYLLCLLPAEAYVGLTNDARGGIDLYGFLFFGLQLFGLALTYAADRSKRRIFFTFACASTACFCPLVFGAPTEVWAAHALFWPVLALCHYAGGGIAGFVLVLAGMQLMILTHEGAVIYALVILATLALRGFRDPTFLRAAVAFAAVFAIWLAVKAAIRPDSYISAVLAHAAWHVFDLTLLDGAMSRLLIASLVAYLAVFLALRRYRPPLAHLGGAVIVAVALAGYWLWIDQSLHTQSRYFMRTVLLIGASGFAVVAALFALSTEGALKFPLAIVPRLLSWFAGAAVVQAAAGALLVVTLIHIVETAKFVAGWNAYRVAMRLLAMGSDSNPSLGNARFVSSERIGDALNRLNWNSTTPFLSVLVAPGFAPERLVVDPQANYFWISCDTAKASEASASAIPAESRRLIRLHACLHR